MNFDARMSLKFDTIIFNGVAVTVNPNFDIIERAVVGILNGKIAYIDTRAIDLPKAREFIDARGGILLPGLINTHTHLPMTIFRGLADDLPLEQWLNSYIFPAEAKHIHPESVKYGTLLGCAEMLLSGTTTCCDGYFFEDYVAEAIEISGMRAVVGQGVIDLPAPGVPDPRKNIQNAIDFTQRWINRSERIIPSIFCHSPYTCSEKTLINAKAAASSQGILFQVHAAETRDERAFLLKEKGKSVIEYLDNLDIIDEKTLIVHGVWLTDEDLNILASRKVPVSHNPQSNMKLAAGIAPVTEMLKRGIRIALGTDGCASNNTLDLISAMNLTAKLHKAHALDPTVADAKTVLEMATIEGAKSLGMGKIIGSLEPGKSADIIILATDAPHLIPMYNPVSHLVYAARASDVSDVMIRGKWIVRNHKLLSVDLDPVKKEVRKIAKQVQTR
jgi:5-methylthioadenosine/S-adenosylhomocysteine deaminase